MTVDVRDTLLRVRLLVILVAAALMLTGCGGDTSDASPRDSSSSTASSSSRPTTPSPPTPTPTPAPTPAPAPAPAPTQSEPTTAEPTTAVPTTAVPTTAVPTTPTPAPTTPAPVVVLDPGHNGGNAAAPAAINAPVPDGTGGTKPCNTTGTSTDAGYPEHAFAWDTTLRVRDLLTAEGVQVLLTRSDDTGVGPCVDSRGEFAASGGAAAFISVHGDGAAAGSRGFHVITSSRAPGGPQVAAASQALAVALRNELTTVEPVSDYLGTDGLDVRGDLAGLNLNTVPAVFIECGNMRNATDAALISSAEGRQALAAQITAGVLTFLEP